MSLVLDASALVALVADGGPEGRWVEGLIGSEALVAPHLALAEAGNILRRFTLSAALTEREAALAHADLLDLDLELFPYAPFAARIWQLRGSVTVYDAWYVALAEEVGAPLATLDRKLARARGPRCRFLVPD